MGKREHLHTYSKKIYNNICKNVMRCMDIAFSLVAFFIVLLYARN